MSTPRIMRKAGCTYQRQDWSTTSPNCLVVCPNQRGRQLRVDQQARYCQIRWQKLHILKRTVYTSENFPYTFNVTGMCLRMKMNAPRNRGLYDDRSVSIEHLVEGQQHIRVPPVHVIRVGRQTTTLVLHMARLESLQYPTKTSGRTGN